MKKIFGWYNLSLVCFLRQKVKGKKMSNLLDAIDKQIGEVRTESLDLSFGEIVNLHKANELVI